MSLVRRLSAFVPLAAALAAAFTFASADRVGAAEPAVLYVSGMQIGTGNRAVVRLTNVSPNSGDFYDVRLSVFETTAGRQINSRIENLYTLFKANTLEIDVGAVVTAYQGSLGEAGNTRFRGPVQVVLSGSEGAFTPFGPDSVRAVAVQTEGKATYAPHTHWRAP